MAQKPKLFLDTNVCGKLVKTYAADKDRIVKTMNREFQIVISAHTLIELVIGMMVGPEEMFESDKERIRVMVGTRKLSVLPLPVTFALKTALNIRAKSSALPPSSFQRQLRVLLGFVAKCCPRRLIG